jgi:formamidopyrimidine-DNA glycosylase
VPELPDVAAYLHALAPRIVGARLERVRLLTPFLLRSVDPPLSAVAGKSVVGLRRLGKRVVIALQDELFLVSCTGSRRGPGRPARSAWPPSTSRRARSP